MCHLVIPIKMHSKLNIFALNNEAVALKTRKQLMFGIFVVLMILIVSDNCVDGRTIDTRNYKDIMIADAVVQCRTNCVQHFLLEEDNKIDELNCREHNNCAMCWDFCDLLFVEEPKVFKSICTSHLCVSFNSHRTKSHNLILKF